MQGHAEVPGEPTGVKGILVEDGVAMCRRRLRLRHVLMVSQPCVPPPLEATVKLEWAQMSDDNLMASVKSFGKRIKM